jgi:hypothetical protein
MVALTNAGAHQPTLAELDDAATLIYRSMPATPQYRWPLLEARVGTTTWVKHENHTPTPRDALSGVGHHATNGAKHS